MMMTLLHYIDGSPRPYNDDDGVPWMLKYIGHGHFGDTLWVTLLFRLVTVNVGFV